MLEPGEVQAVLAWSALPFVGERSLLALLDHAREGRRTLADLWKAPLEDLARIVRLHPKSLAALDTGAAERWQQAGTDAAALRAWGVDVLLCTQPDLPAALRRAHEESGRRWPMLFAYGALGLLEEPRVALASSKTVSNSGLVVTDALADALARRDVALVTSTNRESYTAAATAAKRHAGPAALVLDRGIIEAFPSGLEREPVAPARVWDEAFDPDLQLLLSPFGWRERWTARSGPRRDALIFDLADVVVAVDVRSGGNIDRECREALRRGKPVLALDRGGETAEGTRRLWEEEPGARRVVWAGGDTSVQEVLNALPGERPEAAGDRWRQGWQREIGQFLARTCSHLAQRDAPGDRAEGRGGGAVAAFPASGALAQTAAAWSRRSSDASSGAEWMLADLVSEGSHSPGRIVSLLTRVARGGLLAAIVPAAWLQAPEFAAARGEWLERAALRIVVRLPEYPTGGDGARGAGAAAVVLERDGRATTPPAVFAPQRERMGRFHLRRYLQEVLAALAGER